MFLLTVDLFVTVASKDRKQFECEIENQLLRKEVLIALASTSVPLLVAPTIEAAAVSYLNGSENTINEYLIDK